MFYFNKVSIIALITCICLTVEAQLVINELCPDNTSVFAGESGDYPDWIELYNSNTSAISLEGFFLSDDRDNIAKWKFPNISIGPKEYLIIIADGQDFYSSYLHTNFKLSKDGENLFLANENKIIIDEISFPQIPTDNSYGRTNLAWGIMNPSPGEINTNETISKLSNVNWSLQTGNYTNQIEVVLSSIENGDVKYILNDKPKNAQFEEYQGKIPVNKTSSICAYVEKVGSISSDVICQTFFINEIHNIPIISISGNNYSLFDSTDGIFSLGTNAESEWPFFGANFWEDTEVEIYIEYIKNNKTSISQSAGLKMHGGRESRTSAMKSMRLVAKEKYGNSTFNHPVFIQKPNVSSFKKLVLRNASGDYNEAHMRDGFLQSHLSKNKLNIDFNGYQPVAVYINGQYYGFMGLREKIDQDYIKSNYNFNENEIDLLENDTTVIAGASTTFFEDYEFITKNDISNNSNYEIVKSKIDIESFVDYFIAEISTNNTAWPNNNIRFWKSFNTNSKWRYLLYDMDIALGRYSWTEANVNVFENKFASLRDTNKHLNIFNSLMTNTDFKHYFLNRSQDISNTVFEYNYFLNELENHVDSIRSDMSQHFEKWDSTKGEIWESKNIEKIKTYILDRPESSRNHLIDYYNLDGSFSLGLSTVGSLGHINLNSLDSLQVFNGYYFNDIPIKLSAINHENSDFSFWKIYSNQTEEIIYSSDITLSINHDTRIEAHFKDSNTSNSDLLVSYNNLNKELRLRIPKIQNSENKKLNIYDSNGQLIFTKNIVQLSNNWSSTNVDINTSGIYFIFVVDGEDVYSNKLVISN